MGEEVESPSEESEQQSARGTPETHSSLSASSSTGVEEDEPPPEEPGQHPDRGDALTTSSLFSGSISAEGEGEYLQAPDNMLRGGQVAAAPSQGSTPRRQCSQWYRLPNLKLSLQLTILVAVEISKNRGET